MITQNTASFGSTTISITGPKRIEHTLVGMIDPSGKMAYAARMATFCHAAQNHQETVHLLLDLTGEQWSVHGRKDKASTELNIQLERGEGQPPAGMWISAHAQEILCWTYGPAQVAELIICASVILGTTAFTPNIKEPHMAYEAAKWGFKMTSEPTLRSSGSLPEMKRSGKYELQEVDLGMIDLSGTPSARERWFVASSLELEGLLGLPGEPIDLVMPLACEAIGLLASLEEAEPSRAVALLVEIHSRQHVHGLILGGSRMETILLGIRLAEALFSAASGSVTTIAEALDTEAMPQASAKELRISALMFPADHPLNALASKVARHLARRRVNLLGWTNLERGLATRLDQLIRQAAIKDHPAQTAVC